MPDLVLKSPYLADGASMPMLNVHGDVGGADLSPALSWEGAPEGTRSFAITCFDPDEPTGVGFVHWLIFNLDGAINALEEGAGSIGSAPEQSELGFTDCGVAGYSGPAPSPADPPHRYAFTLYALDVNRLDLDGPYTTYAMLQLHDARTRAGNRHAYPAVSDACTGI